MGARLKSAEITVQKSAMGGTSAATASRNLQVLDLFECQPGGLGNGGEVEPGF
jgi:hypothetical protein